MKMAKREEIKAFESDFWRMLHPTVKFTYGDVAQRFDSLPNKAELVAGFETGKYGRESFCNHFNCKKWVYDFLSDAAKMKCIEEGVKVIEKKRVEAIKKCGTTMSLASGDNVDRPLTRLDFHEPTIIVVVNKYWKPSDPRSPSLYDCARGYWRVGATGKGKAYRCKYAVASFYGRVAEVYEINRSKSWMTWRESPKVTWPEDKPNKMRRAFEGHIANAQIRARYIGRSTAGLIPPRTEKVYVGM